jgi:hypothetical protein
MKDIIPPKIETIRNTTNTAVPLFISDIKSQMYIMKNIVIAKHPYKKMFLVGLK